MTAFLEQAAEIFLEICDLAPAEQSGRLSAIADAKLRSQVEELLKADREPDERLERCVLDFATQAPSMLADRTRAGAGLILRMRERRSSREDRPIVREVARGGMGTIYEVWDEDLERRLAMKVIRPAGESSEPPISIPLERVERFLVEARITGQLDHPSIVPVHELGVDEQDRPYFTMKLVEGRTLERVFALARQGSEGWSQTRVLGVFLRICEAMAYAHSKGVIHRDLKPSNVMVGRFGEVYVMDWGVAHVVGAEDLRDLRPREPDHATRGDSPVVTLDGSVVGTPHFISPEQASGLTRQTDARSDIYAVGAMLYALFAPHPPYGDAEGDVSPYAVLARVRAAPPARLEALAPSTAPELVAIVEKAMARSSNDRYGDIADMADDLRAFLEGRAVRAHRTGAWIEAEKWIRRNRALSTSIASVLVVLAGGLLATSWQYVRAEEKSDEATHLEHARSELTRQMRHYSNYGTLKWLQADADRLWPLSAKLIPACEAWIGNAMGVAARRAEHAEALDDLRRKALPWSEADRVADLANHPDRAALKETEKEKATFVAAIDALGEGRPTNDEGIERELRLHPERKAEILALLQTNLSNVQSRIESLRGRVKQRVTWRYADPDDERWDVFLHGVLTELDAFADPREGYLEGTSSEHGVGVRTRLALTREIARDSSESEEARARWLEAIDAIADPDSPYRGLRIAPQWGLLPLGADPRSGLWEFAHLQSGRAATRGADGDLALGDETGAVLVLLPGGRVLLGAQDSNPDGPNFEPGLLGPESPPYEVELAPFFLSKFELTQAQWLRACGSDPSNYGHRTHPGPYGSRGERITGTHPVEHVSWDECSRILGWLDLTLPAEAQWEYAVRGGSSTIFWTGDEITSLAGAANIADRTAHSETDFSSWPYEDLVDDGWLLHAPVDLGRPNPFGLHGMLGNVSEWCKDSYGPYSSPVEPETGARSDPTTAERVFRDSNYESSSAWAKSSYRNKQLKDYRSNEIGVRPARLLVP